MKDTIKMMLDNENGDTNKKIREIPLEELASLMAYAVKNYDNETVKKVFNRISLALGFQSKEHLGYIVHESENIKLKLCFIYYIRSFDILVSDIIQTIKDLGEQDSELYDFMISNFNLQALIEAASSRGLQIPNKRMIEVINKKFDTSNNKRQFLELLLNYPKPNQMVYDLIKKYLSKTENTLEYYTALNSVNAPFELIFDHLVGGGFFPNELGDLYQYWVKSKDFRAFLLEEYLYTHRVEVPLVSSRPRIGLLGSVLRDSNLNNYYMALNYWRLSLPEATNSILFNYQVLKIYTEVDLNTALADYLDVGSKLDEQYLELTALKRKENYLQR